MKKIKNRGGRKFPPKFFFLSRTKFSKKLSSLTFSFPTQKFHFSHKVFTHKTLIFSLSLTRSLTYTHTQPRQRLWAEPSPATMPTRPSPAIDSSPPWSLYCQPIPISSLSLTTRSFLPFSLSPLTTPIRIHFSSPYPYPYPFRFCLVSYLFDFLFRLLWNFAFGFGYLTLGYLFKFQFWFL